MHMYMYKEPLQNLKKLPGIKMYKKGTQKKHKNEERSNKLCQLNDDNNNSVYTNRYMTDI